LQLQILSIIVWPFKKYCHFPYLIGASIVKSNGKRVYSDYKSLFSNEDILTKEIG